MRETWDAFPGETTKHKLAQAFLRVNEPAPVQSMTRALALMDLLVE